MTRLHPAPWLIIAAVSASTMVTMMVVFWDAIWPPGPSDIAEPLIVLLGLIVLDKVMARRRGRDVAE